MRILSFSYCFPSTGRPSWGVFVYERLAAVARREGVELEVVSPVPHFPLLTGWRTGKAPARESWRELVVHRPRFFYLPGVLKSLDGWWYARGLRRWLGRLVESWRPDLLDAHFVWPDGVGVARLARELGLPYAITLRGKIYPCLEVPSQRRQCAEALGGATAVISVDSRMAQIARELGAPPERVHVIPNGVDLDRFRPGDRQAARRRLGLPANGRLLVTVGHLGPRKGHRETIRALARMPEDVRLVLVGGERTRGDAAAIVRLAGELGLGDRLVLAGPQPHERIGDYLTAADASILASYREGCPNAVLESLACGRPVVATDVGAVPDLIEGGRNGLIVPVRDVDALAAALGDVLGRTWDAEEVRGGRAVQSWADVAGQVVAVLERALSTEHKTRAAQAACPSPTA